MRKTATYPFSDLLFMVVPNETDLFQDLVEAIFAEVFHFEVEALLIDEALSYGDKNVYDLSDPLTISAPSFSSILIMGTWRLKRSNNARKCLL